MDATIHLAPIGDAVHICCVNKFEILFHRLVFLFAAHSLTNTGWFGASIGNARYKRKKYHRLIDAFCLFMRTSSINFTFLGRTGNSKDDIKIKRQTNLDRRGPRPIANPPFFSIQTTFNRSGHKKWTKANIFLRFPTLLEAIGRSVFSLCFDFFEENVFLTIQITFSKK
jgi:hypothetical protein